MKLLDMFRVTSAKTPAATAKERLQIILAHERGGGSRSPDYLPLLQKEILAVIAKYVEIDERKVRVELRESKEVSTLEVDIELPDRGLGTRTASLAGGLGGCLS